MEIGLAATHLDGTFEGESSVAGYHGGRRRRRRPADQRERERYIILHNRLYSVAENGRQCTNYCANSAIIMMWEGWGWPPKERHRPTAKVTATSQSEGVERP